MRSVRPLSSRRRAGRSSSSFRRPWRLLSSPVVHRSLVEPRRTTVVYGQYGLVWYAVALPDLRGLRWGRQPSTARRPRRSFTWSSV